MDENKKLITLDVFVTTNLGKELDFDGVFDGQCVDLVRYYIQDVLGFPQPLPVVGARNLWLNFDIDENLYGYYDRIPNTPFGRPNKGDIMVWDANKGGGFGHTSVFLEGGLFKFRSFDQNDPTLSVCTVTEHDFSSLYGWLSPKISTNKCDELEIENEALREALVECRDHEKFWFDALKMVGLPEDSKWKHFKAVVMKLYSDKQKYEKRIEELEDMIATNVTGLDSKKDGKYVYSSTALLLELIQRLKGV